MFQLSTTGLSNDLENCMGMYEERIVANVKSYKGPGTNKTVNGKCNEKGYPTVGGISGSGDGRSARSVVDGVARPATVVSPMAKQKGVVD